MSDQTALKRLLALQVLINAADGPDIEMRDLIRRISTVTRPEKLGQLRDSLRRQGQFRENHPLLEKLVWLEETKDLVVRERHPEEPAEMQAEMHPSDPAGMSDRFASPGEDSRMVEDGEDWAEDLDGRKITSSHLRGEAYELLCAILFQCKEHKDFLLYDYDRATSDPEYVRVCRVSRVFLSESMRGAPEALQWEHNRKYWGATGTGDEDGEDVLPTWQSCGSTWRAEYRMTPRNRRNRG